MAYTQADIDRLDAAIASAELEVDVDGTRVRYRDMGELRQARKHVADTLAQAAQAGRPRASFHYTPILGRERG